MVDLSNIIDVTTRISAAGVPRLAFGRGLLVSVNAALPAGGSNKAQLFDSIEDVVAAVPAGDTRDAASTWFSADPPPQGLFIGRWAADDVATVLTGGAVTAPPDSGDLDAANAAFTLNGVDVTVDLGSEDTYAAIASAIQTVVQTLAGIYAGATFTYTNNVFVLSLAGSDEIAGGALGDTAGTTDTDIAAALGMAADSDGRNYVRGANEESIADAVADMVDLAIGGEPVAVMLGADVPLDGGNVGSDTRNELATYAQASQMMFGLLDTADQVLVSGDTTSHAGLRYEAQQGYVFAAYSEAADRRTEIGALAALSAQRLDLPASIVTLNAKTLPGVLPSTITNSQLAELRRKRTNVYASVNGTPAFLEGYTSADGYWSDAVWWNLWLRSRIESEVWSTMRGARRFSRALLIDALTSVLESGVRNGGIQAGRSVSTAAKADIVGTTGNQGFDGVLSTGYLVWVDTSPSAQDVTDRQGRFKLWATGSDVIHRVVGTIIFEN